MLHAIEHVIYILMVILGVVLMLMAPPAADSAHRDAVLGLRGSNPLYIAAQAVVGAILLTGGILALGLLALRSVLDRACTHLAGGQGSATAREKAPG